MDIRGLDGSFDVVVVGGGSGGVAAAAAAAQNGAETLLIEAGPFIGGDLASGLPILGCCNSLGRWIVGGVVTDLLERCKALGGYVGCLFDWRTLWGVCVHPDVTRLAASELLADRSVSVLINSFVADVRAEGGVIRQVGILGRGRRVAVHADTFVDCTGDADVAFLAGAQCEKGGPNGEFQPVSMVFQMAGVDFDRLLDWVGDHPEELLVAENPIITKTRVECAAEIRNSGFPFFVISAEGPLLGEAIAADEMYPCTGIFMSPTSMANREVVLNTTRIADIDATDSVQVSSAFIPLMHQVRTCMEFAQRRLPGFGAAGLSRIGPRIGVRETRRVVGEHQLTAEDVIEGTKSEEGIARGGHHVDIHGSGTYQKRIPIKEGRSYDIPYGCLIPRGLKNLLVAGRCISSTRDANGSARVMGTCMATGQAAGTAAALCAAQGLADVRDLPVQGLRQALRTQCAILEGTS